MKFLISLCLISLIFSFGAFVHAQDKVVLLAEDDWYPYTGRNDAGVTEGIAIDLITAAFKAADVEVEFQTVPYDRAMARVRAGDAVACFNTPREPNVEKFYQWPEQPLYSAGSFYFARKDFSGQIDSIADAKGLKVGLVQGYGYSPEIDNSAEINKVFSSSDTVGVRKLMAGRVDVVVVFEMVAAHLFDKMGVSKDVKKVGETDAAEIYLAFSKDHPDAKRYLDKFNQGFSVIRQDGTWQQILTSWNERYK